MVVLVTDGVLQHVPMALEQLGSPGLLRLHGRLAINEPSPVDFFEPVPYSRGSAIPAFRPWWIGAQPARMRSVTSPSAKQVDDGGAI